MLILTVSKIHDLKRIIRGVHYGYPPLKILPPSKDEVLKKCLRIPPPSKDGVLKKYLKILYPQDIFDVETLDIFYIEVQFFSLGGSAPQTPIINQCILHNLGIISR